MGDVTELLEAALKGDREAQDKLYRLVEPELRRIALHWLQPPDKRARVTDLLIRSFEKVMRIRSAGWKHRGQFFDYAARNMPCVLIDMLRQHNRAQRVAASGEPAAALEVLQQPHSGLTDASLTTLQEALQDLERVKSPLHRRIVELTYFGECTLDEIAELIELHRSSVHRMLADAKEFLREKLQKSFPDFGRLASNP